MRLLYKDAVDSNFTILGLVLIILLDDSNEMLYAVFMLNSSTTYLQQGANACVFMCVEQQGPVSARTSLIQCEGVVLQAKGVLARLYTARRAECRRSACPSPERFLFCVRWYK
jgi:hypothetical protein